VSPKRNKKIRPDCRININKCDAFIYIRRRGEMELNIRSNDTIFAPIVFTLSVYVLLFFLACAKAVYSTSLIYNPLNSEPINLAISNMLATSLIIGVPLGLIVYFHSKKSRNNVTELST
jgi:hypothetical protein